MLANGRIRQSLTALVLHMVAVRYPIIPTSTRYIAIGTMTTIPSQREAWKGKVNI